MPPKTITALRALAAQEADGLLSERAESAIDEATAAVIAAYGAEVGGKSKALRLLLRKGAAALLAERTGRA